MLMFIFMSILFSLSFSLVFAIKPGILLLFSIAREFDLCIGAPIKKEISILYKFHRFYKSYKMYNTWKLNTNTFQPMTVDCDDSPHSPHNFLQLSWKTLSSHNRLFWLSKSTHPLTLSTQPLKRKIYAIGIIQWKRI